MWTLFSLNHYHMWEWNASIRRADSSNIYLNIQKILQEMYRCKVFILAIWYLSWAISNIVIWYKSKPHFIFFFPMIAHGAAIKRRCQSCQDYTYNPYPPECYSCPNCYVCTYPTANVSTTAAPGKIKNIRIHSFIH